jgi:hypothetical protein
MPSIRTALLAGGAALALTGTAAFAQAQTRPVALVLPGGVVEILAPGPVTPQILVMPETAAMRPPVAISGPDSPFALLDRISAEMDRQEAAMLREVQAISQSPPLIGMPVPAAFGNLPPGVSGYTMVSTMSGNGVCTQTVRVTYAPGEAKPQVVSSQSGSCGAGPAAPAIQPARQPAHIPGTRLVKNGPPQSPTHLVRPVADWNG